MPQAPTNLERFRCRFSKSGNIRKHCTITHRFYNLPGRRIQTATVWQVSHKYPLFLRRSLSQILTGFLSGNLKKLCEKRAFVWFFIPRPAAKSVPEFLKKSVHSACEMCPAEEGLCVPNAKTDASENGLPVRFCKGVALYRFSLKARGARRELGLRFYGLPPFDKPPTKGYNTDIWFRC